MPEKVLVLGCSGQLGAEWMRVCQERGFEAVGLKRADLDVTQPTLVRQAVEHHEPSLVLNATAYNFVDRAEEEPGPAFAANVIAVRNIAEACRETSARLVHISTDYVFGGTKRSPYVEEDRPDPLGIYAITKLGGEHAAQAYVHDALIVRTCGVFGIAGLSTGRGNFIETMLRLAKRGGSFRVIDYIASPTSAAELARCTLEMAVRRASGIFHCGGGTALSWFDFARLIFEEAGEDPELHCVTDKEYKTPAQRPSFSALSNRKMEALGVQPVSPLRSCVRKYLIERAAVLNSTAKA